MNNTRHIHYILNIHTQTGICKNMYDDMLEKEQSNYIKGGPLLIPILSLCFTTTASRGQPVLRFFR